jgi:Pilus biogenesis CpaD protein (pilus_cpaD)
MIRIPSSQGKSARALRLAPMLIVLMPLAGCGGGSLAHDPFGDAAALCQDEQQKWLPGCATNRNIAAVAEHPRDLDTPRAESPRDSTRRDALISGYLKSSAGGAEPRTTSQPSPISLGGKEP